MTQPADTDRLVAAFDCSRGEQVERPMDAGELERCADVQAVALRPPTQASVADQIAAGIVAGLAAAGVNGKVTAAAIAAAVAAATEQPQQAPPPQADSPQAP